MKAAILEPLLAVLYDPSKGVDQLLQGLSCVSHLLLILFRAHRTSFMTGQLYHDTQAMVRALFHCVRQAQQHCPSEPMFLWQVGTDGLENLFALVRTLTHASNVDAKELADRLGAAVALEEIYNKHPDWTKVSRRLNETLDHMNVLTWEKGGPDCDVRGVDVIACWKGGRADASAVLRGHSDFTEVSQQTFADLRDENITMLRPFGYVHRRTCFCFFPCLSSEAIRPFIPFRHGDIFAGCDKYLNHVFVLRACKTNCRISGVSGEVLAGSGRSLQYGHCVAGTHYCSSDMMLSVCMPLASHPDHTWKSDLSSVMLAFNL